MSRSSGSPELSCVSTTSVPTEDKPELSTLDSAPSTSTLSRSIRRPGATRCTRSGKVKPGTSTPPRSSWRARCEVQLWDDGTKRTGPDRPATAAWTSFAAGRRPCAATSGQRHRGRARPPRSQHADNRCRQKTTVAPTCDPRSRINSASAGSGPSYSPKMNTETRRSKSLRSATHQSIRRSPSLRRTWRGRARRSPSRARASNKTQSRRIRIPLERLLPRLQASGR